MTGTTLGWRPNRGGRISSLPGHADVNVSGVYGNMTLQAYRIA
uniref:Uncharacterized protein n=1 Tax=Picea sitchensis TaxID=3332 RepID=D5A9K1_PICSI|nr:unknown [Picea sitchensis]ADE77322.1 unknown [Picea sitchensis]